MPISKKSAISDKKARLRRKKDDDSDSESSVADSEDISQSEEEDDEDDSDDEEDSEEEEEDSEEDEDEDSNYETCSSTSESSYHPPKRSKKSKKTVKKHKKRVVEDSEDEEEDESEEEELSPEEIRRCISKIFPSKYMSEKVHADEEKKSKKNKSKSKSKRSNRRHRKHESDEEEDSEDEDSDEDADDEADENERLYDIIFTQLGANDGEEVYDDDGDDKDCDSDDEKMFMKESYEEVEKPAVPKKKKAKKTKKVEKEKDEDDKKSDEVTDVEQEYLELVETKKQLTSQLKKTPRSKILIKAVNECNRSIKKLVKKARIRNAKRYHKLIHDDNKNTNEVDYFKKKLSNKEQLQIMRDLKEINAHINIDKPYRLALLESKMPAKYKATALQKLNVLRGMSSGDSEYYKIKDWVDTFMRIPFGRYKSLSITMDDGLEKCHEFMGNAKKQLDDCVYGLNDAKLQILQMLGQWIANPGAMGTAIAINGPPGTGKTSLTKDGISKILGRDFTFIALGGTGDASFLEGHSYTYEGARWGKIVQILLESKCMNPVIYFDELDKVSDTPKGEEIIGILTHLTDTTQNSQFHDKYFADIDFDMSKCLFIFSYNDESKINPILKDRMYRIQTKGYDTKEKVIIAKKHLLPKIREQINFSEEDVIISDEVLQYLASDTNFSKGESGVRNLKRCLEIIYTKLNLFRLVKPEDNLFAKDIDIEVTFPFTVTKKIVDVLIKNEEQLNQSMLAMYC